MSFETCNLEANSCKYAQNIKLELGFDDDCDPKILKGPLCIRLQDMTFDNTVNT